MSVRGISQFWNSTSWHSIGIIKLQFVAFWLFVCQRQISILKLHLMTLNWNYLVTICCFLIILPIIKEELFVFITNRTLFVFITNRTLFVFITNRTLFVFITNRTLFVFITNRTLFVFITNRPFKNSEYLKSQWMYQLWGQYCQQNLPLHPAL